MQEEIPCKDVSTFYLSNVAILLSKEESNFCNFGVTAHYGEYSYEIVLNLNQRSRRYCLTIFFLLLALVAI